MKPQTNLFSRSPLTMAVLLALLSPVAQQLAHAGAGWGDNVDINNQPIKVPTFNANSPSGLRSQCFDANGLAAAPVSGGLCDSGTALRKFVDELPGLGEAGANKLGQYLPVAVAEKWVDMNGKQTQDDYYEIAIVEYAEKMHSDLPKPTRLRGYVQLETPSLYQEFLTLGAKARSKHIKLTYPDGTAIVDRNNQPVYAVDKPHYLGPVISATRGVAVRIKYTNYLPFGGAKGSELFIPVDSSMQSAGLGPDGVTPYTQNRAAIHWHGGDTPWISDGTPHQWIAPAGEAKAYADGYGKGVSAQNVPDMPDPGPGSGTLYFPNNLSGRLMFYHDHTTGLTRLNVYAGIAAGYLLSDHTEATLVNGGDIPSPTGGAPYTVAPGTLPADQIPLVIQDKTFVPKDVAQQDAKWDTTHWGEYGDLWFTHVYETNQDPNSWDGTNPVGRWDWGPWFWPVFPAQYSLPSGVYGDESTTPEAFMDTPIVNGTAYPTTTVQPKAYRFRILNACNDRFLNLGLYVADTTSPQALAVAQATGVLGTEPQMVPFAPGGTRADGSAIVFPDTGGLQGTGWGTVNSMMSPAGVPDPASVGPDMIQIGTEGGFLPHAVTIPSTPINFEYNKRSITVLNVLEHGLFLGAAERADVVIDFSKYAGKTLILYNDAPAPLPAGDPRIDYYTNGSDNTGAGGSEPTKPGYGPNTRTIMRIVVDANGTPAAPFDVASLEKAMPHAYAAEQERPVIPEAAYNDAFGTTDANNYAKISAGTLNQPTFDYTPSGPQTIVDVNLVGGGTGYKTPPAVKFTPPAGASKPVKEATAVAGIGIGGITLTSPGSMNYTSAPQVVFSGGLDPRGNPIDWAANPVPASATAIIAGGHLQGINVTNPGSFSVMPNVTFVGGGATTQATATVRASGKLTSVVLTDPGQGYDADPVVTFSGGGGIGATASVTTTLTKKLPVLNKGIQELFDPLYGRMNATFSVELPFTNATVQTTIPLAYVDESTEAFRDSEFQIWKITHNGVDSHPVHFHLVNVQVINRVGWDGTIKPPYDNELGWKETVRMNPLEDVYVVTRAKTPQTPGFGLPESVRLEDPSQPAGSKLGFTQINPLTGFPSLRVNKVENFDNEYVWHCHILGHEENDFMRPITFHPFMIDNVVGSPTNGQWIVPGTSAPGVPGQLAIPAAPTGLTAASQAQGVVLNWTDKANTEYQFDVLRSGAQADATGTLVSDGNYVKIGQALANQMSYTDGTADSFTSYAYKVVAIGAKGSNESTPTSLTTDVFTAPGTPVVAALAQDASTVVLSWADVKGEQHYEVQRAAVDAAGTPTGWTTIAPSVAANSTGYTDNTVQPLTTYAYQVVAVNTKGSTPSNTVTATTPDILGATGLTIGTVTDTQATLSWTLPTLPAGAPAITNVQLLRDNVVVADLGVATSYTDTGLTSNTAYSYTVVVTNAGGHTKTSNAVQLTTLPAPVQGLTGTVTADTVTLSWSNPNLPAYTVEVTRTGGNLPAQTFTVAQGVNGFIDTVAANTAYTYTVTVKGQGGAVSSQSTVTETTLPVALTPAVVTPVGSNAVALTWDNTANNGGASTITVYRNGTLVYTDAAGTSTGWTDTGLVANTGYSYTVTVTGQLNTVADSANSAAVTATTAPLAMTLQAPTVTARALTLNWAQPVQGPLSNILVTVTETAGPNVGAVATLTLPGTATTTGALVVDPKATYSYTVDAVGLTGTAQAAGTVATPAELLLVNTLSAQLLDATTIQVQWLDNSTGESGYKLEQRMNGGAWTVVNASVASVYGTGQTIGVPVTIAGNGQYDFRVTPMDVAVAGPVSGRVRVDLTVIPNRPATLTAAIALDANNAAIPGAVNLSWADTVTNNSGYEIWYRQRVNGVWSGWTTLGIISGNANSFAATGLPSGNLTQFEIRAVNGVGNSQWRTSNQVTVQ